MEMLDRFCSDHLPTRRSYLLSVKNVMKDLVTNVLRDLVVAVVEDVAIEAAGGFFETLAESISRPSLEL
jgi:hypothetical protein